jgi:two-component system, sensor histidine kinase and response regulator
MLTNTPVRILLVEDDAVDRESVRRALRKSGLDYDLHEAADGEAGLDAVSSEHFDCVLLDYHLPGKSGIETFRAMPRAPGSTTAVIFLTGEGNEELALTVMEAGAVDYLTKDELQPAIARKPEGPSPFRWTLKI